MDARSHGADKLELGRPLTEPRKLREQVYDRLRSAILNGRLSPGTPISPAAVAKGLRVSTMPVREAIRLLEDDGLVETSARRWTRVATVDPERAREIYPLVGVLEEYALVTAEKPSKSVLSELRNANRTLRNAAANGDVFACVEADRTFHQILMSLSTNETLVAILDDLKAKVRLMGGPYFQIYTAEAAADGHDEIIKHLKAGDLVKVGQALRNQWQHGCDILSDPTEDGKVGLESNGGQAP